MANNKNKGSFGEAIAKEIMLAELRRKLNNAFLPEELLLARSRKACSSKYGNKVECNMLKRAAHELS